MSRVGVDASIAVNWVLDDELDPPSRHGVCEALIPQGA